MESLMNRKIGDIWRVFLNVFIKLKISIRYYKIINEKVKILIFNYLLVNLSVKEHQIKKHKSLIL
jgi:hypothetical protein